MRRTTCHIAISIDGLVAGPDQSRENPVGASGRALVCVQPLLVYRAREGEDLTRDKSDPKIADSPRGRR
jgi:nicotinamide mononucleotide (NMN) deamidase PncC